MENQNLKSCISNIYEIRDEMQNSIRNINKVMEDQEILKNIIKRSKEKKRFEDLVKGFEEDKVGYKNQLDNLNEKIAYANAIIGMYEAGHKPFATDKDKADSLLTEQVVTTMCLLLKIVPSMTDQRIEAETKAEQAKLANEAKEEKAE